MTPWPSVVDEIARFRDEIRELPVSSPTDPERLRRSLEEGYDFRRPRPLKALASEVVALLREHAVQVTHPRYFGLFNPSVREAGIVADTLAALYNPQLAAWSHAPAACELERLTLRAFARALGLDPDATAAHFTGGGAEANLTAVLAALSDRWPEARRDGLSALPGRPSVYLSEESHHSFVKIARMAGLGTEALRFVSVDDTGALDPRAVRNRVREDRSAGRPPLLIVGTAGTTSSGAVDPLGCLADVAEAEGVWFHVDAAWGGAAALSVRLRPCLAGVERADSVTWDAHKWLSVPMGAGMFFCRRPAAVRRAFGVATPYMPETGNTGVDDPFATTVQWSRRAIGLKVFLSLAELGLDGYGELIERQAAMGDRLRAKLADAGWTVVNRTPLPLVCFSHSRLEADPGAVRAVAGSVQRRGRAWISDVVLRGRPALRACITSYRTREEDLDVLIEELDRGLAA